MNGKENDREEIGRMSRSYLLRKKIIITVVSERLRSALHSIPLLWCITVNSFQFWIKPTANSSSPHISDSKFGPLQPYQNIYTLSCNQVEKSTGLVVLWQETSPLDTATFEALRPLTHVHFVFVLQFKH